MTISWGEKRKKKKEKGGVGGECVWCGMNKSTSKADGFGIVALGLVLTWV